MIDGRRFITAVVGVLLITAAGYAGMVPARGLYSESEPVAAVCDSSNLLDLFISPSVSDLRLGPVSFLPKNNPDPEQANQFQHTQTLTEGTDSLSLCLSALMGLGLCGSVHWVKRLHWGAIPEWYHDGGGPFQIGHSHAVNPNTLCTVPVYCFIQPDCTVEDALPQYRLGTVVSLWRKSQFTSTVLAPRGPPVLS